MGFIGVVTDKAAGTVFVLRIGFGSADSWSTLRALMCLTGASETSIRKRHEETYFFYREATLFLPVGISVLYYPIGFQASR